MPTRDQALRAYQRHRDYRAAGAALGVPPGQAYLAATGLPADGGGTFPPEGDRPGALGVSTQHLVYGDQAVRAPASQGHVLDWVKRRAAADAPMQAAARARDAAPGEPQRDDTDIVSVLTRQHDQVAALMKQLKTIPGVTKGGSAVQQSRRASIADMVAVELSRHEAAEEEQFWPWVRSVLGDGDGLADTAARQEQEGKDLLAALAKADASEERFDELVEELEKAARKHVAFEDRVLLKLCGAASPEDRAAAGERFLRAQRHAPARPHRRAPAGDAPGNDGKD
jgi:Hemerythrin HHE cation binding domain